MERCSIKSVSEVRVGTASRACGKCLLDNVESVAPRACGKRKGSVKCVASKRAGIYM